MSFKQRIKRVLKGDTHRAGGYRIINGKPKAYTLVGGKRVYTRGQGAV